MSTSLDEFFGRMSDIELASYMDIAAKKATCDDERALFAVVSRNLLERRLRDRKAPEPAPDAFDDRRKFNEVVGLMAQHGFDTDLVREAAEIAARADLPFIAAGLDLYVGATRFGMKDGEVRIAIREGWEAGLKAREKGGAE